MSKQLNTIKTIFTEALFPAFCYKCKAPGTYLCPDCFWQVKALYEPACPHCETRLPFGEMPDGCRAELKLHRIFACGLYSDKALGQMVKDMKYKYAQALASPLSAFALWQLDQGAYLDVIKKGADVIIPVPMHKNKLRKRGFNQAELIADYISKTLDIPLETNVLIKIKKTEPQAGTNSRKERLENLEGAFGVSGDILRGKTVLLVDDVITTGSTMRQCAVALRAGGAREVWGLAILKD